MSHAAGQMAATPPPPMVPPPLPGFIGAPPPPMMPFGAPWGPPGPSAGPMVGVQGPIMPFPTGTFPRPTAPGAGEASNSRHAGPTAEEIKQAWKAHSTADGRKYYHNSITGESTWTRPAGVIEDVAAAAKPASVKKIEGTHWKEVELTDGKRYYIDTRVRNPASCLAPALLPRDSPAAPQTRTRSPVPRRQIRRCGTCRRSSS